MDSNLIRQAFGIKDNEHFKVSKTTNGWNVRLIKPIVSKSRSGVSFRDRMILAGKNMNRCEKCGNTTYCHPHHIVPQSAGGGDDIDNCLSLCFDCHVGDVGIHNNCWSINELMDEDVLMMLKKRYKVI